ncbi:MAG: YIP1 family protein [Rhodobacteraceae bacterium]|jgi:hypothetical protein|nr:YIP1 family protein [Paracoccaceae bacterium]
MTLTFADLMGLARQSLGNPRGVMRQVLALPLTTVERWQMLVLAVALSAIAGEIVAILLGVGPDSLDGSPMAALFGSPLRLAAGQVVMFTAFAWFLAGLGARMGGRGDFGDMLMATCLLQFLLLLVQLIQVVLVMALPPLASIVGLVGFFLFFWWFANFIAEVHGYTSLLKSLLLLLVTLVTVAVGLTFVLSLLGVTVPGV